MKCFNCEKRIIGRSKKSAWRIFKLKILCGPCNRAVEDELTETDFEGLMVFWLNSEPAV